MNLYRKRHEVGHYTRILFDARAKLATFAIIKWDRQLSWVFDYAN